MNIIDALCEPPYSCTSVVQAQIPLISLKHRKVVSDKVLLAYHNTSSAFLCVVLYYVHIEYKKFFACHTEFSAQQSRPYLIVQSGYHARPGVDTD